MLGGLLYDCLKAETEWLRVKIGSQWTLWNSDGNAPSAVIMFGNTCGPLDCVLLLGCQSLAESWDTPAASLYALSSWHTEQLLAEYRGAKETCYLEWQGRCCPCVLTPQIIIQKLAQLSRPARFYEETLNLLSVCQSAHLRDLLASSVEPSNAVSFDELP